MQNNEKKFIVREHGVAFHTSKIRGIKGVETEKVIHAEGKQLRKSGMYFTEWTSEKAALCKEYNEKLAEFLKYQKEQFGKIFGDEQ